MKISKNEIQFSFSVDTLKEIGYSFERHALKLVVLGLVIISVWAFMYYYNNGLGLAYNDARSHLDIGRRVVEGLKPGLAQLGSVWLPLPHLLMVPTIWSDFMWHSGLAGALVSMISFVATGVLVFKFLERLGVGLVGRIIGVIVFVANLNVLYLQSTAMTELLLLATMTAAVYYLYLWLEDENILNLVKGAFWVMLSTLVRYDGWFLFALAAGVMLLWVWKKRGYWTAEGTIVMFCTLGGFGIVLWLVWNLLIFKDPLYFAFGPYSAYAQQKDLESAGDLITKHNWFLSWKFYFYALAYNSGAFTVFMGLAGALAIWFSRKVKPNAKIIAFILMAPLLFNVLALYLGHSVLFIQGLSGDSWFNVRYGIMMMPSLAIFIGYLVDRAKQFRAVLIGLFLFVTFFQFASSDAVTIDDALVGSSQKNVTEVSSWLGENAGNTPGFILISAASHDAIIFSSGLPMSKFIHEGTGAYWQEATTTPDKWARWIVMRTYSDSDSAWRLTHNTPGFERYEVVQSFPFADIYKLKDEYLDDLITEPILGKQK